MPERPRCAVKSYLFFHVRDFVDSEENLESVKRESTGTGNSLTSHIAHVLIIHTRICVQIGVTVRRTFKSH